MVFDKVLISHCHFTQGLLQVISVFEIETGM